MKATAIAHSNIAFVKYWGKADPVLFLPTRSSLSMTLDALRTMTTVEFSEEYEKDTAISNSRVIEGKWMDEISAHLDRIRKAGDVNEKAKVVSETNFPMGAGLAGSASYYAALTVAGCAAAGLDFDEKELSIMSRQGSGSSCRSIKGGYVEWIASEKSEESYGKQLYDENYYDIRDVIAIVSQKMKKVRSREGMVGSKATSPMYSDFIKGAQKNINEIKKGLENKDFTRIGKALELDGLMLHAVALTTQPPLIYWNNTSIAIMHEVLEWRGEGIEAYFTFDAGPNAHIITLPEHANEVEKRLKKISGVLQTIQSKPGGDARVIDKHLF